MREAMLTSAATMLMAGTVSLTAFFEQPRDLRNWITEQAHNLRTSEVPPARFTARSMPQTFAIADKCLALDSTATHTELRYCANLLPALLEAVQYQDTVSAFDTQYHSEAHPGNVVHAASILICRTMWARGAGSWAALEQPLCSLAGIELDSAHSSL